MPVTPEIIDLARGGDSRAFEQIVSEYQNRVFSTAYRICGSREDALDLSQEVFLRVFSSLSSYKGEATFSTWLYRVCVNLCIDYGRKNKKHPLSLTLETTDEGAQEYEIPDVSADPHGLLEQKQTREQIQRAMLELSEDHRVILVLREIDGLSYDAIAGVLNLETGTVRSRIARARLSLREVLLKSGNFFDNNASNGYNGKKGGDPHD